MSTGDTEFVKRRTPIQEAREWVTFIASIIAPVAIAWGATYVKNQRLEIKAEADREYVAQTAYEKDKSHQSEVNIKLYDITAATNTRLDTMNGALIKVSDKLDYLAERISERK
jgi:hypothetical protein